MQKLSFKNIHQKSKPSLVFKTTFLFTSLFVVVMVLFSIIMAIIFSYRSDRVITTSNTWAMEQLAMFTDKYIFEKMDDLCDTYFNLESENEHIKKFFTKMENMSVEEMRVMQDELKDMKKQNSFLDNIILYNGQFDSIVSTDDGIVYGASDIRNNISIQNRFFSYLEEITSDFYVPQDDNIMLSNQKNSILYVHYVSSNETSAFGKRNVNCVIIAVDIDMINHFINDIDIPGVQCFAILDNEHKALIHSDNFPGVAAIKKENSAAYSRLINSSYGAEKMKYQNSNATYIWTQSQLKDWKYVYIISIGELYNQVLFIIICIACITLLTLMLVYFLISRLSTKLYRPFTDVIDKVKHSLASESHSDSEVELLNHLVDDFSQKQIELINLNKKYSELRLYRTASDIINGFTPENSDEIVTKLSTFNIDFSRKRFALIIIEFNEKILRTFSNAESDFILYDVMDALYETFNCVISLTNSNALDLVINEDRINYDKIIRTLKQLIPEKSLINIFVCGETDDISRISEIHTQSCDLLKYSYIHGYDNIFYTDKLIERERDNSDIDPKHLNRIENALRNGDRTQFYDECNYILTGVKKDNHSFRYAQHSILRIFSTLCRIAKELDIPMSEEENFEKILDNSFFDESTIYLFELSDKIFDKIISRISTTKEDKKQSLIISIKDYIDEHIAEDISLSAVAQQFNISTGYLSKFFKEYTSESFSKYIIEKKFEYAANVLTSEPDKPIAEIANSLGYFDTAYFSRQFKSHYGVTPVQYRKMNSN